MRRPAVVGRTVVALLAVLSWSASARAATTDQAWLAFTTASGTQDIAIPVVQTVMPDGTVVGTITNWSYSCTAATCGGDAFQVQNLNVTLDGDPTVTFGGSTVNFGATPTNFGYVFSQAITPTAASGTASSSFSGSTNKGGGAPGTVTIAPAPPPAGIPQDGLGSNDAIMVYNLSTDGGATWLNPGIDLGPAFASNPTRVSDTYGPYNSPSVSGPAASGTYNTMRVDVNFSLSGGGDRFTWNGNATIVQTAATPEPSTVGLLALGMVGIGWVRRRGA